MSLIILGVAGVASAVGITVLTKKQIKAKEEHYQMEKIQMVDFIQKILSDRVIFRKVNSTMGFLSTHFQATEQGFVLDVMITKDELQFYLHSTNKGRRMYYHYIFNRAVNAGQLMNSQSDFVFSNEALLLQLEQKMIQYNWENPLSFYAKKTFEIFGGKKTDNSASFTKEEKAPEPNELQQEMNALEDLYGEIKQVSETIFDYEEKYKLERLFHQDFHRLKESYLSIQNKTPEDIKQMKESLLLIEHQLRAFYIKADMHHKRSFERAVEILKHRNETN